MRRLLIILILSVTYTGVQAQTSSDMPIEYDKSIKMYYVVELTPNKEVKIESSKRMKIQQEHIQNIRKLVKDKKLVMAGPFPTGGGLFFMSVSTEEEARKLIEKDPTIKAKLNTYYIRPWMTERGLFTLDNPIN